MIRIYILHIEFHWGYWPKISIKRKPRHGQYAVDGGYPGKLVRCPTCQDGFLFEQDPFSKALATKPMPDLPPPEYIVLPPLKDDGSEYELGELVEYKNLVYEICAIGRGMEGNATMVHARRSKFDEMPPPLPFEPTVP